METSTRMPPFDLRGLIHSAGTAPIQIVHESLRVNSASRFEHSKCSVVLEARRKRDGNVSCESIILPVGVCWYVSGLDPDR